MSCLSLWRRTAFFRRRTTALALLGVAAAVALLLSPMPSFGAGAGAEAKEAELRRVRSRIESIRKAIHTDAEKRDSLAMELKSAELAIQSAR